MKNQHIVVAGAGIGGLAAALTLARAGQRVTLLERAAEFAELGAGIQLGPHAIKLLSRWGLREPLLARACLPEAIAVRDAVSGRSLSRILLGQAVQARYGEVYASVRRADLHALLLQAVRDEPQVTLHCNAQVNAVHQDAGLVNVQSAQGSHSADGLVAADGVWSGVRSAVFNDGAPRATGHAAYRAMLPMAQCPSAMASSIGVWWGRDVHVVHYPVHSGQYLNLVVLSEHSAARAVPGWASPASAATVLASVQGACAELKDLLGAASAWYSWHLYDRPAARSWVQGHVALMGDAAHPMLPYLAQGAAMALEDAQALADCTQAGEDWAGALGAYEQQRKSRCERVVATARRNARIFHLGWPWALARNAVLTLQGTQTLGMPWLYGYG